MKKEGEILKDFIENQKASKTQVAKDLDMSRQNLYQLFNSEQLELGTKKKIEDYFKAPIFNKNSDRPNEKNSFSRFLIAFPYLFKDKFFPDEKRERIKTVVKELNDIYQLEEIYRRMGISPFEGSETFLGVVSPDNFIELLVKTFNVNRSYILDGSLPILLSRNPFEIEALKSTIAEKEEIILTQKATIESQKVTIQSQQELIEALKRK